MKKVAVVLVLCLLVMAGGCFEKQHAWGYGNPESQGFAGMRFGSEVVENLEMGASVNYSPGRKETSTTWSCNRKSVTKTVREKEIDSWTYGAHALYHFGDEGFDPYAGAQVNIGTGNDVLGTVQPIGGVALGNFFAEYQAKATNDEQDKVLFGLRFNF